MNPPDRDDTGPSTADPVVEDDSQGDDELRQLLPVIAMLDRAGARMGPTLVGSGPAGVLGDFRIVRVVGRGGMGVVYEAVQESLNRRVALKILPSISAEDPRKVRRFQVEAQAAACLQHPHIVPVYLVGSEDGLHYYAMQFIEGQTLAEVIATPGSCGLAAPRMAAALGRQAALALHFAHEQGITHRDVKPSNLLIDASGWLWVGDFGLARIAGQADLTLSGAVLGTLRYMSPEQAAGSRVGVDHRSDVYSLGVTLYELIAGRPAFEGDDRLELLRRIGREAPRPPRRIDPAIPRDLETIVLRAMARDPGDRYATALELADDLGRFLHGRPIIARPPGPIDRASKWAGRNKAVAMTAMMVLLAAVMGLVGALAWRDGVLLRHNRALRAALDRAEQHESTTRRLWYDSQVRQAQQCFSSGQVELAQEILDGLEPGYPRGFEWHYLRRVCHRDVSVLGHHQATSMVVSPDGRTLVLGEGYGSLVFWDLAAGRERARLRAHEREIAGLRISADGRILASWSTEEGRPSEVKLWDPDAVCPLGVIPPIAGGLVAVDLSSDGRRLTLLGYGLDGDPHKNRVISWDLSRGPEHPAPGPEPIACDWMACSPDGRWLATAMTSGRAVTLRDAASGRSMKTLTKRLPGIRGIAFSPDGKTLAAYTQGITVWETSSWREIGSLPLFEWIDHAFSPDGDRLAGLTTHRRTIELVKDVRTNPRGVLLEEAPGQDLRMAFSPDGKTLAGGGGDLPLTLWETSSGRKRAVFPGNTGRVGCLAFAPGGESLIFGREDGRIRSWHFVKEPEPIARFAGHRAEVWGLAYAPDGRTLITSADDGTIKLWDPRDSGSLATLPGHESLVASVAVSPDGKRLASAGFDGTVRLWDLPGGRPRRVLRGHTDRVRAVVFSPDGRLVASGGSDGTVRVWDLDRGETIRIFDGHGETVRALAFDPRGRLLVSAGNDRTIRGIDLAGGREVFALSGPRHLASLAFSPDGTILASGDDGGNIATWDVAARSRRWTTKGSDAEVWGLAFAPDGRTLAAACGDAKVRLWDPLTGQVMLVLEGHSRRVNGVAFSPDGRSLASVDHGGEVRIWHAGPP